MREHPFGRRALSGGIATFAFVVMLGLAPPALAQSNVDEELRRLQESVAQQQRQIEEQQALLRRQQEQIDRLRQQQDATPLTGLDDLRAGALQPDQQPAPDEQQAAVAPPGEGATRPPPRDIAAERAALPQFASVLTPQGHFQLEPSIELTRSTANRLVFRGIEVVVGLQIGVIEASDVDRDIVGLVATGRYGLTDRLELEFRAPYYYRHDRVLTLAQRDDQITRELNIEGASMGDLEGSLRYQFNSGQNDRPIYIANLRVKSNTGTNPFEIERDEFGIAEELATGSGFWAIEPGATVLIPTEPVVIYASLSYLWHLEDDIDRQIGDVFVGTVDPGDAITAGVGFGFALNRRFSYSLGYRHAYIYPTHTELGATTQESEVLQPASLLFGMAYQLNQRTTANLDFEFGVTDDAADTRLTLRFPFTF